MKPSLSELAGKRDAARKQLLDSFAVARAQLSPSAIMRSLKTDIRARSHDVARASIREVKTHRGLIVSLLAAVFAIFVIKKLTKTAAHAQPETKNDR